MKKTLILALVLLPLLCSCDFVRKLAGRPTSAQVEQMRQEKEQADTVASAQPAVQPAQPEQAQEQVQVPVPVPAKEQTSAREAQLLDSLSQSKGTVLNPSKLGGLFTTKLEYKYYIVVGSFRTRSYAERKLTQCNENGYTATIISFRNGLMAVAICPSNDLEKTLKTLKQLRGTTVCPQDGWILMNI